MAGTPRSEAITEAEHAACDEFVRAEVAAFTPSNSPGKAFGEAVGGGLQAGLVLGLLCPVCVVLTVPLGLAVGLVAGPVEAKKVAEQHRAALEARRQAAVDTCVAPIRLAREKGPTHPELAPKLESLAGRYVALEKSTEAESLYRRALAIRETAVGPDDPDLAPLLEAYAGLLHRSGRGEEAAALSGRAATIRASIPAYAVQLAERASSLAALGHLEEAQALLERALRLQDTTTGVEVADVIRTLEAYADLLRRQGQPTQATLIEDRARQLRGAAPRAPATSPPDEAVPPAGDEDSAAQPEVRAESPA